MFLYGKTLKRYIFITVIVIMVIGILMGSFSVTAATKKVKASPTPTPSLTPTPTIASVGPMPTKRIVGYFPEWGVYEGHNYYKVEHIPWGKLTHIQYAFAKIDNGKIAIFDKWAAVDMAFDGDNDKQPVKGNFNQFMKHKARYPRVQVLISVGGWTCSAYFSDVALTDESRKIFAASCVDFIRQYKFDGVDIDWEYPANPGNIGNIYRPEDKHNFTLLLKELREQLDAAGQADQKRYALATAVGVGADIIDDTEPVEYQQYVDYISLMTYDMNGAWSKIPNHHSPLYKSSKDPSDPAIVEKNNIDWVVNEFIRLGVDKNKLNVGVPYYSRGWADVTGGINGLFGKATWGARGIWDAPGNRAGQNPFYYIKDELETNKNFVKYRDPEAQVPYLFNAADRVFYTYEDEISLANKCDYVLNRDLSGITFWEVSGDWPNRLIGAKGDTLTSVIYDKFTTVAAPSPTVTPAQPSPKASPAATPDATTK